MEDSDFHEMPSVHGWLKWTSLSSSFKAFFKTSKAVWMGFQGGTQFSSVQSLSCVQLFATPGPAAHQASLSITKPQSLPKLMSIELVMPSNCLILCHPLLLLLSIFPSIMVFSNESALCIRWPKNWSFSFSISPSNEYSGLISFRMDWLDILAVQGTLKSLLQHHSSKASILWHSTFFIVQLSHPYMTTGKTIALTRWTFVDKGVTSGKESARLCRRLKRGRFETGLGRSRGGGNGNAFQYSCLENPMDRGAWWAAVHGVAKSWTQMSNFTFTSLSRS